MYIHVQVCSRLETGTALRGALGAVALSQRRPDRIYKKMYIVNKKCTL
jgi:hypothetical protein